MTRNTGVPPFEILLVEDNAGDVRLVREALLEGKLLHRLHSVQDGEQAMLFLRRSAAYAEAPRPDLILLDLNLPRRSGREVLAEIKSDAGLRRIPVAVLTSSSADEDVARSYDLHANCYVTKPVDFTQFARVVQAVDEFWFTVATLPPRDDRR
jgi:CheY-like chemotaxis protein